MKHQTCASPTLPPPNPTPGQVLLSQLEVCRRLDYVFLPWKNAHGPIRLVCPRIMWATQWRMAWPWRGWPWRLALPGGPDSLYCPQG